MRTLRFAGLLAGHLLFWGWNLSFLALVWLGLGPTVLWQLFGGVYVGLIPWHFGVFAAILLALPVAAVALGAWKLRSDPGRLLSLLYGVQAPLMLLCLVRIFAVGPLTAPTALALGLAAIGTAGLLRTLLSGFEERSAALQVARLVAQSAWMVAGLWAAALLGLYALPIGLALPQELWRELWGPWSFELPPLWAIPQILIFGTFFAMTAAMMAVYPVAAVGVAVRAWQVVHRATAARLGAAAATGTTVLTLAGVIAAFGLSARQPQREAFSLLEAATDDTGRRAALLGSERIREGLVAARLGPERLFDGDPEGEHVAELWDEATPEPVAAAAAAGFRALMRPFLYRPAHEGFRWDEDRWGSEPEDVARATAAYAAFFDAPMEVAEREVLLAAARQTWSVEQAHAGLLDVGGRKVRLARQEVTVAPHGDVAVVTIHDEYRNLTFDPQEVLVSFSLPESAAATGLWLGSTDRREEAFPFVVAPRGAAQEVYESEVRVRRDPALLEQVGPRQYRLRAFPIPAREGDVSAVWTVPSEGEPMHLWLELVVPIVDREDGAPVVPMPEVAELRNLTLVDAGERTLDGAPFTAEGWLPADRPAADAAPRAHRVRFGDLDLVATPAGPAAPGRVGEVVVLVDGTRSMAERAGEVDAALARLREVATAVDVWCVVEGALRECADFSASSALFYGSVALETRLAEVAPRLPIDATLVVLTDRGSYELAAEAERAGLPDLDLPETWLVHLGGLPSAYPDWTLDRVLRSGGGAVTTVDEWLARGSRPDVVDGWSFALAPADPAVPAETGPFAKLAARRAIALLDAASVAHGVADLDRLHAIAKEHGVVTSYSSMLVLVEERQRQALDAAEQRADRFDREVIDAPPEVSSVPEPSTWLLLLLGGGGLALRGRAGRRRA